MRKVRLKPVRLSDDICCRPGVRLHVLRRREDRSDLRRGYRGGALRGRTIPGLTILSLVHPQICAKNPPYDCRSATVATTVVGLLHVFLMSSPTLAASSLHEWIIVRASRGLPIRVVMLKE